MFKLLYADITNLSEDGFEGLCKSLSEERLKKVKAQKNVKDSYLSAAAGYLLHAGLLDFGVIAPQIYRNEHGKPYLKDSQIYFNLSHSGNIAVCALSSQEVGVDVQQVKSVGEGVIKRVCTKEEYAFVTQDTHEIEQRFCRLWAIKESVIKCLGKGLSLSPSRISVNLSSACRITIDGAETNLCFKEYALNGYCIAVCSAVDNFSTDINKISL